MIWPLILLSALGAYLTRDTGLFPIAVVNAVLAFWGNGVMANFRQDPHNAPNYAAVLSMATAVGSVVFIIAAVVL